MLQSLSKDSDSEADGECTAQTQTAAFLIFIDIRFFLHLRKSVKREDKSHKIKLITIMAIDIVRLSVFFYGKKSS